MNPVFPQAKIPLTPLLEFSSTQSRQPIASVLDLPHKKYTTSGRAALALALKHINLQPGDEVLIPAFHCEAMVAPVIWLKGKAIFYKINRDTQANIDDIQKKLNHSTKAILATHYFGFAQQLDQLREICSKQNIVLIEDCAHAFFGATDNGLGIGATGDYTIASSMKFFPIYEGGLLCSSKKNLDDLKLTPPDYKFQLKAVINTIEKSIYYHRLGLAGFFINALFYIKTLLWTELKKIRKNPSAKIGPGSSEGGFGLDPDWVYKKNSVLSEWLIKHADSKQSAFCRRENYKKIDLALSKLDHCHPLFTDLPENTVPFVYPLYVDNPKECFTQLKQLGVPIWRFGEFLDAEVTMDTCPTSVEYSEHIFQFPCHQSLTKQEIEWMITQISNTLSKENK